MTPPTATADPTAAAPAAPGPSTTAASSVAPAAPARRPAAAGRYSRRISLTERSYLMAHLMAPPMAIQVFVEGAGALDPDELARAVATASAACPGARVVRRGPNWVDGGQSPPVVVVDGADFDRETYGSELLRRPFDPAKGPNCEVLLVTGEPTLLVFRVFHAVMDGKGVMAWITEVFRALRGEPAVGAAGTETEEGFVARFATSAERPATEARWPSPLDGPGPTAAAAAAQCPAPADGAAADPGWLWARRTVAGVHPALIARTAVALTECAGEDGRFMVPVNLRRHDPTVLSTANLTLPILLDVPLGTSWRRVQGTLVKAMMDGQELNSDGPREGNVRLSSFAGLAPALAAARAADDHRARYQACAILSELGRPDLPGLSGAGFTARTVYSLPMYVPYAPAFLTLYQLPDRVEIAMSCRSGPGTAARAHALLDRIEAALSGAGPAR
ncbi:hypothetical protein GCM10009665_46790 [Kitasatospora nipponensis]|uniref:Condensation domain-containing protein n=1 Tax=Kitasatospora nipponensis TaxID=258049 RepID=A0ABN1WII1_9ACTN